MPSNKRGEGVALDSVEECDVRERVDRVTVPLTALIRSWRVLRRRGEMGRVVVR